MTIGGWIFMLSSVLFVVSLTAWCFSKVLKAAPESPDDTGKS